jgi:hypothetical protein
MPDVSVVVADVSRTAAIRDGLQLPGRTMHFTSGSLASAVESIRAYRPKVVAIDALFAQTPSGASFADRIEAMSIPGIAIRLIVEHEGRWTTTSWKRSPIGASSQPALSTPVVVARPQPTVASLSSALAAASHMPALNTRRAPRFLVRNPVEAVIESGRASVIDMSVLGAQIVSLPTLRPNQKVKLGLPDTGDVLNLIAEVAWSMFEQPAAEGEPHYRAGIEFTNAAQQVLEDYRRRHCAEQPIPLRGR